MFGIGPAGENVFNGTGRFRPRFGGPGDEALWRPFGELKVRPWHMFGAGGVFPFELRPRVRGDSFPVEEALHDCLGVAHVQFFPHQAVRHAAEVVLHLNVVIHMDPRLDPVGIFVRRFWQREHGGPINLLEAPLTSAREFAEGAAVEQFQALADS